MINKRLNQMHPRSWKKDLYICFKTGGGEDEEGRPLPKYHDPTPFLNHKGFNYQPIKEKSDIEMFGASSTGVIKAVIKQNDYAYCLFNEDSVGSVAYLNEASPYIKPSWATSDIESQNGEWANYEVNAVRVLNLTKHIYFVKYKSTGA